MRQKNMLKIPCLKCGRKAVTKLSKSGLCIVCKKKTNVNLARRWYCDWIETHNLIVWNRVPTCRPQLTHNLEGI